MIFTAENCVWNIELLREAALRGDIRLYNEDGKRAESIEEIEEFFRRVEEGYVVEGEMG